jgi:hypothetical protein
MVLLLVHNKQRMDENRTETAFRGGPDLSFADPPNDTGFAPGFPPSAALPGSQGPAKADAGEPGGDLPSIILAAAGLTVFDSIIIVVFLSLWAVNPAAMLAIIKTMAGIALLLGVAPIVIGGLIMHTNKQNGTVMPGTPWAGVGILVGVMLSLLTILIPLLSAVRLLVGNPAEPL